MTESKKLIGQSQTETGALRRRTQKSDNALPGHQKRDDSAENPADELDFRHRLIADNVTDMVWTIELDGAGVLARAADDADPRVLAEDLLARRPFSFVSPASRHLLGFDPEEMRAKTVKQLLQSDSYASALNLVAEELAAEVEGRADPDRVRTAELQHVRADGSFCWCEVEAKFLRDESGAIRGLLGVTRDVSGRKTAEEALRESATTILNLFTHLPDVVLVVDRSARVRFVNRDAPGVPAEHMVGSNAFDYVLPRYRARCQQTLERAFVLQEVQQIQVRSRYHEWLDCRVVPMPPGDGPASAMIICTDFTQKRSSERFTKLQLQLSERLSETSELEPALEACLDAILTISETDGGGIYLAQAKGDVDLVVHRNLSDEFVRAVSHYDADTEPAGIVTAGVPVYARLDEVPEGIRGLCGKEGLRCFAFVPISYEGRPIACANVASRSFDTIPASVRGGLEATAALIGSSVARIQAEEQLRRSEERLRLIAQNVTDVVWTARLEGISDLAAVVQDDRAEFDVDELLDRWRFTFISPSVERILGYSVEEGLQLRPQQLLTPASYAAMRKRFATSLAGLLADNAELDQRRTLEVEHVTRDGRRCWCEITVTFFKDDRGSVVGMEGVTRDISQRKRFERELSELITKQQQRMGQELHDELGQQLVGARLIASGLQQALTGQSHPSAGPAAELVTALSHAETSVRQLIKGVRPVEVAANGLMAALGDLVDSTRRLSGVPCVFRCEQPVAIEDSHTATQLFYIAREAVHNAVKHASARTITIDLAGGAQQLQLGVADDGRGMPADPDSLSGMGLRIMRHRAAVIGAGLVIDTAAGGGTRVTCRLPVEQMP
jgi:PAS domain S-box-containing protein